MPTRRLGVVGPALVLLAIASAVVTFLVLTGLSPFEPTHQVVIALLAVNVGFGLALIALIGVEVGRLVRARYRGQAGAALHMRIIGLFSIVAAMPAILVSAIAFITLDRGLDNWFSTRVRNIVETSLVVANAYVEEQGRLIQGEALAMASDLNRAQPVYGTDPQRFIEYLKAQGAIRGLPGAMLMTRSRDIKERADILAGFEYPLPPAEAVADADNQDAVVIAPGSRNVMGAVVKLSAYDDRYLFVARPFDPKVAQYLRETQASTAEYRLLEDRRSGVQVAFAVMFVIIALLMLLAAIWIGLAFADRLVEPIRRLINAADQVAEGNLYVRVPVDKGEGDLANLGATFNNMTDTLRSQRNDLLGANDLLDSRRRFMEAVLSGVSTGVIGIDEEGKVTVLNPVAERLIGITEAPLGQNLSELVPELAPYLTDAIAGRSRLVQGQIALTRDTRERNVMVRVTSEQSSMREHGYVVTLDDITELVVAQRSSAWADVARRIAHEIKNPLTPIQLSAERIRRKYGKVITEDREVFDQCTDTIVRQVDDIKRMVDEFSSFARMPKPAFAREDLADMVKQVVFLMRVGNPEVNFEFAAPAEPVVARFDRRLLSQAVTNIVKNAAEAIAGVPEEVRGQGQVSVSVVRNDTTVAIEVTDNGVGLPKENRQRLLEPYVTTREKGTGLGLAIVGKIMEEHGGGIELLDAPAVATGGRGALLRLWFPVEGEHKSEAVLTAGAE
ncbi:two-component system nitrogen regulation sensor histidine kinase NtrY [Labrys wisconsinensis]|uniref:histidine kinase n=1 Tax=Labrys wisconsinensis TaxID=425677 RepID=A0ABU0J623_9HYPH|nr:two-component system nitrogen regulation sensor histidine kinase NtrY [Labrys wisconsinensis]